MKVLGYCNGGACAVLTYSEEHGVRLYRAFNSSLPDGNMENVPVCELTGMRRYEGYLDEHSRGAVEGVISLLIAELQKGPRHG